jgi:uncharacterized spore protein YtfJ
MRTEEITEALAGARESASVRQVVGEATVAGGRTIIPLARISNAYGFGYGTGPQRAGEEGAAPRGGGGGGRAAARPVAIVEVTPNGTRVTPVLDVTRTTIAGIALAAWTVFWVAATVRRLARR